MRCSQWKGRLNGEGWGGGARGWCWCSDRVQGPKQSFSLKEYQEGLKGWDKVHKFVIFKVGEGSSIKF